MLLIAISQPLENIDRFLDGRLADLNRLEPAFQRRVPLDVLSIFVHRGRADALQFAPCKGGLEDVGRVYRALGRAGAHERMQLVDEEYHFTGGFAHLFHDALHSLFELAAVFGPRDQPGQIQGHNALIVERFRRVATDDPLCQAFGYGGLADTRFAYKTRVVLGPSRENLDDPLDLVVPADARVQLALPREFGVISAELVERGGPGARAGRGNGRCLAVLQVHHLSAGPLDIHAEPLQHARGHALRLLG